MKILPNLKKFWKIVKKIALQKLSKIYNEGRCRSSIDNKVGVVWYAIIASKRECLELISNSIIYKNKFLLIALMKMKT